MTGENMGAGDMAAALLSESISEDRSSAREGDLSQARGRTNIRRLLVSALLWLALTVLLVAGAMNAGALRQYPTVSLRYETPVSGQAAYRARQYAAKQTGEDVFWLTFWHQTEARFSGGYNNANAECIFYSGDAALVWPARYLYGAAPGVTDGTGCAVSSALAWKIWGSADVVGKTLEAGGEIRTVRGVFEGDDLLALLSVRDEDTGQSYTAVELSGGPASPGRGDVESFITASGLGTPDSILMGTPVFFAEIMAILPLLILACYGLALWIGRLRKRPAVQKGLLLFAALMAFALLLPGLLEFLPGWMIPTRWSDFSFWSSLGQQISDNLREYLTLTPGLRDVEYMILLLKQAGIAFLSACCALSVCFRWHFIRKDA